MATLVKDLTSSVMTGVSSFGNKALDAFGINQATLSGAIDIVVVKHPPGSRPRCLDEEYKANHISTHTKHPINPLFDDIDDTKDYYICSPFHVRFGKLQLLRSNEVNVSITINDKHIDTLAMKLGIDGVAYFVVPTNKPLQHKNLLTSPLNKPQDTTSMDIERIPTLNLSPTLSATSSIALLEDTGTDNESLVTTDNESNVESLDDVFNNEWEGATHVMIEHIGMSLCGDKLSADSEEMNKKIFEEHRISYTEFCHNPSLVFDCNLIILYNKRLYPAKIAFPQIFALLSFGKALSNKAIKDLNCDEKETDYSWYWSWFKKKTKRKKKKKKKSKLPIYDSDSDDDFDITSKGIRLSDGKYKYFISSLRPTSDNLSELPLRDGVNHITFTVSSTLQGTQSISGCIFLWNAADVVVISDVDGTITKSDVMGHVAPLIVGSQWSHNGVAQLFTNIVSNGYQMLYLTSRGIGQSSVTRSYLFENVKQRNFSLPFAPIIMSPDSLTAAFYREIIIKKPQEFKIPALHNIASLFPKYHNPFYAGFGNRSSDLESYLEVGVPKHRIFIIKPSGNIYTNNKIFKTTYLKLNQDVQSMFMDRQNVFSKEKEEFNSFNFWRAPINSIQLTDLDDDDDDTDQHQPIEPNINSNVNLI